MNANYWELLSPKYVSDFFGLWYSSSGVAWFVVFLIGLFLLWAALLWLTKKIEQAPATSQLQLCKRWRVLILLHWAQKSPRDGKYWAYWGGVFVLITINLIYVWFHWRIVTDPGILVADSSADSLQKLNSADFILLNLFFYRWIALGWGLMIASFAVVFHYFGRGYENLQEASQLKKANLVSSHKFLLVLIGVIRNENPRLINESLILPPTEYVITPIGQIERTGTSTTSPFLLTLRHSSKEGWFVQKSQTHTSVEVLFDNHLLNASDPKSLMSSHTLRWKNNTTYYFCEVVLK